MKKTTLAILASALIANSALAITIYDHKETGTQIEFIGSARIKWESTSDKTSPVKPLTHLLASSALRNNTKILV